MPRCSMHRIGLIALSLLTAIGPASAGPLDPPAGPVAPTGKSVISTLPVTITLPGSYVLGGEVVLTGAGGTGITIEADDVTLDLAGFTIRRGGSGSATAISIPSARKNVRVLNGAIRGWTGMGIQANSLCTYVRVENLVYEPAVFAPLGFELGTQAMVRGVQGVVRIQAGDRSLIEACSLIGSSAAISTGRNSIVRNCTAQNGGSASVITVGDGSAVSECSVEVTGPPNGSAVVLGAACSLTHTTISTFGSTTSNVTLVVAGTGCTIDRCSIEGVNGQVAVSVPGSCVVRHCTITGSVAGLSVNGTRNRIESNTLVLTQPFTGIAVAGTNNLVLGNSVSYTGTAGTHFSGVTGNSFGPIVDVTAAGEFATTNPWANFKH